MRPTTMAGSSAAEDSGTIATAARNKHTSNPIHLILFICDPSLSTVFAVIVITVTLLVIMATVLITAVTLLVIVTTALIMTVTVVLTTWTPKQSHCNDQHHNH